MPNYTIPPRSKPSDYAKGRMTQDEIIAIQIANDANIAKARKAIKNGEPTQLTVAQSMSPDEMLADIAAQEATARTNLEKLGFRPQEAAAITAEMRVNNDIGFVPFNTNYPAIEADIKKRFNPKLLTAAFFIEYLTNYIRALDGGNGIRVYQPFNGGFNNMIDNVAELQALLPRPEDIDYILNTAQQQRLVNEDVLERLRRLRDMLPTARDLQALQNVEPVRQQKVIDDLLEQFRNLPPAEEFMALRGMIQGEQIDRRDFAQAMRAIVDAVPQGRQENIVRVDIEGIRGVIREELERLPRFPSGGKSRGDDASTAAASYMEEGDIDIGEQLRAEQRAADKAEADRAVALDFLEQERQFAMGLRLGQIEARQLKDGTNFYIRVETGTQVRSPQFGALNKGQQDMVLALKPVGKADLSSLTRTDESASTLTSAMSLASASLKDIKAAVAANKDIAERLTYEGRFLNYNDLSLTPPPAGSKSRKVFWGDTNLQELFQAKFGQGIKPMMGNGVMNGYRFLGQGVKPIQKQRVMVGRGIAVKETPSYKQYGKYAVHIPQLEQQDILNVKYKSLGQVPKFKPFPVSDIFRDFMLDLLENGKPNSRVYHQICPKERKVFEEMSIGAGVWNGLGLKRTTTSDDEDEAKRFELLRGEYVAGNNNPKVISELRRLVVKMMSDGRIRKAQGLELLMELSV
jgi:hypothetical protein